jgi:hypothetical protein
MIEIIDKLTCIDGAQNNAISQILDPKKTNSKLIKKVKATQSNKAHKIHH